MLAIFCLRLAFGMLVSLLLLSPRQMHPRFFRTHFLTVLGLCVVAAITGWSTASDEIEATLGMLGETRGYRRAALGVAVFCALAGAVVWIFERPPAGWALITLGAIAQVSALGFIARQQARLFQEVISAPPGVLLGWELLGNDISSALVLGFAMTAMLVGHSYLISPGMSIAPLKGQIIGLGISLAARVVVAGLALGSWTSDHDITNLNDETVLFLPVRWLIGLVGPLVFGFMAFQTARIRSTQSATGILYVVVILTFLGELTNLLLTRRTGLPL